MEMGDIHFDDSFICLCVCFSSLVLLVNTIDTGCSLVEIRKENLRGLNVLKVKLLVIEQYSPS